MLPYFIAVQVITNEQLSTILQQSIIKPRLRKELQVKLEGLDVSDSDFLVVTTKSPLKGALIVPTNEGLSALPFTMNLRVIDPVSGRSKPVVCDFCFTWQSGQSAARITFTLPNTRQLSLLCCGDLNCSMHVRGQTQASRMSRAQMPEHLDADGRIKRLQHNLEAFAVQHAFPVTKLT